MAANFPLSFRNDTLRKHRRKILLEREKSLLPAMQIFVEYYKNMKKYEAEMDAIRIPFGDVNWRPKTEEGLEAQEKTTCYRFISLRDERNRMKYRLSSISAQVMELKRDLAAKAITQMTVEAPGCGEALIAERTKKLSDESVELRTLRKQRAILKTRFEATNEPYKAVQEEYNTQREALRVATMNFWHNRRSYDGTATDAPAQKREFIMKCADEGSTPWPSA
jgi:hypothetical protein